MRKRDFDPCTVIVLLSAGETPGQKVSRLRSFDPELSLQLVQSSFAKRYLLKAKFWGKELLKSVWFFVHNVRKGSCEGGAGFFFI